MHIEFTLDWSWWQWALAASGLVYGAGVAFLLTKRVDLGIALAWPLLLLLGGVKVQ